MQIIKEGNKKQILEIKSFVCSNCGCEFTAVRGEYKYNFDQREGTGWYECKCPMEFCNHIVTKNE